MRVIAFDPWAPAERAGRLGVELVDWEALLRRSEVLTLHVPLTERTRHLIGREALARMRPRVFIANCARGGLIDEDALLGALEEGQVAGAAPGGFGGKAPGGARPL